MSMNLTVVRKQPIATDVAEFELQAPDGSALPEWEAGAHIDVVLPEGLIRQYSLCGDPAQRSRYRIAVLKERDGGRGGSRAMHEDVSEGMTLKVRGPRNNFELRSSGAYLFIAGGIGITPLVPMVAEAERRGVEWRLVYGGRSLDTMAFRPELERYGSRVQLVPQDRDGLIDVPGLLGTPAENTLVYCCGPESLLQAVEQACAAWPPRSLQVERFTPKDLEEPAESGSFEVVLKQSGVTLVVGADESILDAINNHGLDVPYSCTEGVCGTCETVVLEGAPDHRDSVMSPEEHEESQTMQICVSRCLGKRLVLDL